MLPGKGKCKDEAWCEPDIQEGIGGHAGRVGTGFTHSPSSQLTRWWASSSTIRGGVGRVGGKPASWWGWGEWWAGTAEEPLLRDTSAQLRGPGRPPKPALLPADRRGVWGVGQRCLWGDATGQCHRRIIFPSGKGNLRAQLLPKRTGALSAGGTGLPTPATPRAPGSSVSWEQVSPAGKDSSDLLSLLTPESSTLPSGKAIRVSPMLSLCLHSTGPLKAGVTQTPRHPIKAKGQQVTLRCSPISGGPVYVGINRPQVRAPRSSWSFMKVCKE